MPSTAELDAAAIAMLTATAAGYSEDRLALLGEHLGPTAEAETGAGFLNAFVRLVATLRAALLEAGVDAGVNEGPNVTRLEVVGMADAHLRGELATVDACLELYLRSHPIRSCAVTMVAGGTEVALEMAGRLARMEGVSCEAYLQRLALRAAGA